MARKRSYAAWGNQAFSEQQRFPRKVVELPDGREIDATPRPGCTYTRATWPPRGRGRGESICSPRRIEARLRVPRILQLRAQGHTWQSIARTLGYKCPSGPWRAVRRTVDRMDRDRYFSQQS